MKCSISYMLASRRCSCILKYPVCGAWPSSILIIWFFFFFITQQHIKFKTLRLNFYCILKSYANTKGSNFLSESAKQTQGLKIAMILRSRLHTKVSSKYRVCKANSGFAYCILKYPGNPVTTN